jgi:hypothetical protein
MDLEGRDMEGLNSPGLHDDMYVTDVIENQQQQPHHLQQGGDSGGASSSMDGEDEEILNDGGLTTSNSNSNLDHRSGFPNTNTNNGVSQNRYGVGVGSTAGNWGKTTDNLNKGSNKQPNVVASVAGQERATSTGWNNNGYPSGMYFPPQTPVRMRLAMKRRKVFS